MGRHGVLSSYGITSHCVRAGGITAGPGFLRHLQMATDMPCSLAASRPSLLCPQLASSLYSPPHVESQTKSKCTVHILTMRRCRGSNHFVVQGSRRGQRKSLGVFQRLCNAARVFPLTHYEVLIQKKKKQLLDVAHFHVLFTLWEIQQYRGIVYTRYEVFFLLSVCQASLPDTTA